MDLTNIQHARPANWADFEKLCHALWKKIWQDPNALMNGRQGQPQHGVDIYGCRQVDQKLCAVQCKGKDNYSPNKQKVSKKELEDEIRKAEEFNPQRNEFILATTASRDEGIQEIARLISIERESKGQFPVYVWSWDDIWPELIKYPDLVEAFFPQFGPSQKSIADSAKASLEVANATHTVVLDMHSGIEQLKQLVLTGADSQELLKEFQSELDKCKDLLKRNKPAHALELLNDLRTRAWNRADHHTKFRILTNIASCHLRLDRIQEAGKMFVDALQYNTGKEKDKALSNAAYGYYLLRDLENAKKLIKQAILEFPDYAQAYVIDILVRAEDQPFDQLVKPIPLKIQETEEIKYVLGMQALRKELVPEAEALLEAAYLIRTENNIDLVASLGSVIFENLVSNDRVKVARKFTQEQNAKLQRAESLLLDAWSSIEEEEYKAKKVSWLQNLAQIKRLQGDHKEAEKYIKQALSYEPDSAESRKILGLIYFEMDENVKSLHVLEEMDDKAVEQVIILKAELYRLTGKLNEAITYLETKTESVVDSDLQEEVLCLLIRLFAEKSEYEKVESLVQSSTKRFPDSAKIKIAHSESLLKQGKKEESLRLLDSIYKEVRENGTLPQRLYLADQYYHMGLNEKAAQLYELVTDKNVNSEFTHKLLISLFESGQHKKVIEIAEPLIKAGQNSNTITKLLSNIYGKIGAYSQAIECCDSYLLSNPSDIEITLLRAELGIRVGEPISLTIDLTALSTLSPASIIRYASILLQQQKLKEAVEVIYTALHYHPDNAELHLKYCGLILVYAKGKYEWLEANNIGNDTAVIVKPDNDEALVTYLITNGKKNPQTGAIIIDPKSALALRLADKKIGEKVVIKDDKVFKKEGVLKEIKSKYILLLHHILETFETRFPENLGLNRFNFSKIDENGNTTIDIDKFFEVNKELNKRAKEAIEEYSNLRIPVMFLGRLSGKKPIDSFYTAIGDFSLVVRCCDGSLAARQLAVQHLSEKTGIILDYTAIVTLFELGVADYIKYLGIKLHVTQSTLNAFEAFKEDQIFNQDGYSYVGEDGSGKIYMTQISAEQVGKFVQKLDNIINWIKANCEIIPALGSLDFNPQQEETLVDVFGKSTADTMIEAQTQDLLFYCDDCMTRAYAQYQHKTPGVWSQAILMTCLEKGVITREQFNRATVELVLRRYDFTSIDALVLFQLFEKEGFTHTRRLLFVLSVMGKSQDGQSCAAVSAEFIDRVWNSACPLMIKRNALGTMLEVLKRAPDGTFRVNSASMLLRSRSQHHKQISQAIQDWRDGLLIVPNLDEILLL